MVKNVLLLVRDSRAIAENQRLKIFSLVVITHASAPIRLVMNV